MNIVIRGKMKNTNHQEPMQKESPDAYLTDKAKFLKKYKDHMVDRVVRK